MALTEEERKQRKRESQKRYRETHKDKIAAYSKEYNKKRYWEHKEENKEKHKADTLEHYYNHKDNILEERRKKYATDPEFREKTLLKNKQYKEEHPEYVVSYKEKHKEELKEYNKEYYLDYKETKFGRASNLLGAYKQRDEKIYKRGKCTITHEWIIENIFNGQVCVYCKRESDWHRLGCDRKDSSLPHTPDNCVPCCLSCNSQKGTMSYEEYMKKVGN